MSEVLTKEEEKKIIEQLRDNGIRGAEAGKLLKEALCKINNGNLNKDK